MEKIQELQIQLNNFTILRQDDKNKNIFNLLDENINKLEKEIKLYNSKYSYKNKKELNNKIGKLTEKKNKAELKNDLKDFKELEKEIRKYRTQLKELNGTLKYLTINQIKSIIRAIEKKSNNVLRDKLIVLLGFEFGLRISEIIDLKISDFNLQDEELFCRRLKGSVQSKFEIQQNTLKIIKKYLDENNNDNYFFTNSKGEQLTVQGINYIFKKYCSIAKITPDKSHYHVLKHSRGVWLAENGFAIQHIQILLGHRDIKNTMVYASYSNSQKFDVFTKLRTTPTNL